MMAVKNGFIITIGEYGVVFVLHKKGEIQSKIFIKEINEEAEKNLKELFTKNKEVPVYILLDTVDQSYKKREYPFVKKNDLTHLINRDLASDVSKESVKNYIILNDSENNSTKLQKDKKWNCLFISASISRATQKYIDFINEMPNRLIGIYMLPIESALLFKLLKESVKSSSKISDKKSDVYCLVTQNKVSGVRQTVFLKDQLIFTRLLDYHCDDVNFTEKYEKDLYATSEYLKRLFPEINTQELETINILPAEVLKKISVIKNIEFNFINYTPHKAALLTNKASTVSENGNYCDLLISKIFCDAKKKVLKFSTPKIIFLEKMFLVMKSSYYANLFILLLIGFYCLFAISKINESEENIAMVSADKLLALQTLNRTTNKAFGDDNVEQDELDKILDFGKVHENLSNFENILFDNYEKLKFVRGYPLKFDSINFSLENFNGKNPSSAYKYRLNLKGKIYNKSGDIENLFSEFDEISSGFKKEFSQDKISHSELPKNIDFAQKYFDFPVDFTVEGASKK